jgi:hypothetical protein
VIDTERNPWSELKFPSESYVLDRDRSCLFGNDGRAQNIRVIEGSLPEPFIGNPTSCSVVLLGLNPGHDKEDQKYYREHKCFREALFANLHHEQQEHPFYPLNPDFKDTPVARWWLQKTRFLREALGPRDSILSKRLMVIEWFPYHSVNFNGAKHRCDSQDYSQDLVKQLHKSGRLIIGLSGKRLWEAVVPSVPYLKNPQNRSLSPRNLTQERFDRVLATLRQG